MLSEEQAKEGTLHLNQNGTVFFITTGHCCSSYPQWDGFLHHYCPLLLFIPTMGRFSSSLLPSVALNTRNGTVFFIITTGHCCSSYPQWDGFLHHYCPLLLFIPTMGRFSSSLLPSVALNTRNGTVFFITTAHCCSSYPQWDGFLHHYCPLLLFIPTMGRFSSPLLPTVALHTHNGTVFFTTTAHCCSSYPQWDGFLHHYCPLLLFIPTMGRFSSSLLPSVALHTHNGTVFFITTGHCCSSYPQWDGFLHHYCPVLLFIPTMGRFSSPLLPSVALHTHNGTVFFITTAHCCSSYPQWDGFLHHYCPVLLFIPTMGRFSSSLLVTVALHTHNGTVFFITTAQCCSSYPQWDGFLHHYRPLLLFIPTMGRFSSPLLPTVALHTHNGTVFFITTAHCCSSYPQWDGFLHHYCPLLLFIPTMGRFSSSLLPSVALHTHNGTVFFITTAQCCSSYPQWDGFLHHYCPVLLFIPTMGRFSSSLLPTVALHTHNGTLFFITTAQCCSSYPQWDGFLHHYCPVLLFIPTMGRFSSSLLPSVALHTHNGTVFFTTTAQCCSSYPQWDGFLHHYRPLLLFIPTPGRFSSPLLPSVALHTHNGTVFFITTAQCCSSYPQWDGFLHHYCPLLLFIPTPGRFSSSLLPSVALHTRNGTVFFITTGHCCSSYPHRDGFLHHYCPLLLFIPTMGRFSSSLLPTVALHTHTGTVFFTTTAQCCSSYPQWDGFLHHYCPLLLFIPTPGRFSSPLLPSVALHTHNGTVFFITTAHCCSSYPQWDGFLHHYCPLLLFIPTMGRFSSSLLPSVALHTHNGTVFFITTAHCCSSYPQWDGFLRHYCPVLLFIPTMGRFSSSLLPTVALHTHNGTVFFVTTAQCCSSYPQWDGFLHHYCPLLLFIPTMGRFSSSLLPSVALHAHNGTVFFITTAQCCSSYPQWDGFLRHYCPVLLFIPTMGRFSSSLLPSVALHTHNGTVFFITTAQCCSSYPQWDGFLRHYCPVLLFIPTMGRFSSSLLPSVALHTHNGTVFFITTAQCCSSYPQWDGFLHHYCPVLLFIPTMGQFSSSLLPSVALHTHNGTVFFITTAQCCSSYPQWDGFLHHYCPVLLFIPTMGQFSSSLLPSVALHTHNGTVFFITTAQCCSSYPQWDGFLHHYCLALLFIPTMGRFSSPLLPSVALHTHNGTVFFITTAQCCSSYPQWDGFLHHYCPVLLFIPTMGRFSSSLLHSVALHTHNGTVFFTTTAQCCSSYSLETGWF